MKLTYRILLRILVPVALLLTAWTVGFYFVMIEEVNDEQDDALEEYAENLVRRHLSGIPLPAADNGTNNSFFIEKLDEAAVPQHSLIYSDEDVWIESKAEMEPARVLRMTFLGTDGCYMLTVMTPTIEKADLREAILIWVLILYFSLLAVIAIVVALVLRRSMHPLYELLRWLDRSSVDAELAPLDNPTTITEFDKLNNAVLNYSRRSKEAFEQQKQFIGNASHEIQTPLAVCANRLDMLADTPLSEQQLGEVAKIQNTLEYLSRLNQALLLLTKIDSGQFHRTEPVDLNAIVEARLDDFKEMYAARNLTVSLTERGRFEVEADKTLAATVVSNLLKNAFVHNVAGGVVEVELSVDGLAVRNSAVGEALDRGRVFERFYQSGKTEGSTGLGLAIVASIARLYGFKAEYGFADGLHCFSFRR